MNESIVIKVVHYFSHIFVFLQNYHIIILLYNYSSSVVIIKYYYCWNIALIEKVSDSKFDFDPKLKARLHKCTDVTAL